MTTPTLVDEPEPPAPAVSALRFCRDRGWYYRVAQGDMLIGFVERDCLGQGWWAYIDLDQPFRRRGLFETRREAGEYLAVRPVGATA